MRIASALTRLPLFWPVRLIPHILHSPVHYAQLISPTNTDAGVGYVASPPDATGYPGATCTVVVGRIFSR